MQIDLELCTPLQFGLKTFKFTFNCLADSDNAVALKRRLLADQRATTLTRLTLRLAHENQPLSITLC